MNYYHSKSDDYYKNVRFDIVSFIPTGRPHKILEIGAGACNTLAYLKEKGVASEVVGVELFAIPNSFQQSELIDKLYIQDIEKEFPSLPEQYYDVIILGDVLEHLIDPWSTVSKLKNLLAPEGIVVASLPNFREFSVFYKIFIKGDFQYASSGILDKTHYRFFCKKNMVDLFESSGLKVKTATESFKRVGKASVRGVINSLTLGLFAGYLSAQYLIVSSKKDK